MATYARDGRRGFGSEVVSSSWDAIDFGASKSDGDAGTSRTEFDCDFVDQPDRLIDRREIVKAVGALWPDH